jgi:hypothetical protein
MIQLELEHLFHNTPDNCTASEVQKNQYCLHILWLLYSNSSFQIKACDWHS